MPRCGVKAGQVAEAPSTCLAPVTVATRLRIVEPARTTAGLPHPGQRTPSGQRRWRTKAKHLASSIRPERLTKSDAVMMAKAPRASRSATSASARPPDAFSPISRSRPHHPGTRQKPPKFEPRQNSGMLKRIVARVNRASTRKTQFYRMAAHEAERNICSGLILPTQASITACCARFAAGCWAGRPEHTASRSLCLVEVFHATVSQSQARTPILAGTPTPLQAAST